MKAEGTGKGTMTVVTIYNAIVPEKDNKCDSFDLRVQVEDVKMGESLTCPPYVLTPCASPSMSPHCPHDRQGTGGCHPLHQDHHLHQVGPRGDIRDAGDRDGNGDGWDAPIGILGNRNMKDGGAGDNRTRWVASALSL